MGIEVTQFIVALLGGTTVGGIIEAVRYWRENRRLKESEVTEKETATQSAQIDLADKYFNGMLELLEKVKASSDKGDSVREEIVSKLTALGDQTKQQEEHLARVDVKLGRVETYLNGQYQEWLRGQAV